MKKIIIIEDDLDMRDAMTDALSEAGYTVSSFETSEEALQAIVPNSPDLILLDVMTHSLHASVFLKRLREFPSKEKDTKVIIITNLDNEVTRQKVAEFHIESYLIKSKTSLEKLIQEIETAIGKS